MQTAGLIINGLIAIGTIAIAVVAIIGLTSWKKQYRAKVYFEIASDLLYEVKLLQSAIHSVRYIIIFKLPTENDSITSSQQEIQNEISQYDDHMQKIDAITQKIRLLSLRAEIFWNDISKDYLTPILNLSHDLRINTAKYSKWIQSNRSEKPDFDQKILYPNEDDSYGKKLQKYIDQLKHFLSPFIRDYST